MAVTRTLSLGSRIRGIPLRVDPGANAEVTYVGHCLPVNNGVWRVREGSRCIVLCTSLNVTFRHLQGLPLRKLRIIVPPSTQIVARRLLFIVGVISRCVCMFLRGLSLLVGPVFPLMVGFQIAHMYRPTDFS